MSQGQSGGCSGATANTDRRRNTAKACLRHPVCHQISFHSHQHAKPSQANDKGEEWSLAAIARQAGRRAVVVNAVNDSKLSQRQLVTHSLTQSAAAAAAACLSSTTAVVVGELLQRFGWPLERIEFSDWALFVITVWLGVNLLTFT